MAADGLVLRGITWNHPRGVAPLEVTAASWREQTGVDVRWEARSLRDFGDASVEGLARTYDLIVLDYPHMGAAHAAGALVALDQQLDAAFLEDQSACSVGASHRSYQFGGHQWALAIDAAAQVSAVRPDLLELVRAAWPTTWDEVEALCDVQLASGRSAVAWPLAPADSVCSYLSLALDAGAQIAAREGTLLERAAGEAAFARLASLAARVHPRSLGGNPIAILDLMATGDEIAYVPLTFGYTNYSRDPAARPILFGDVPTSTAGRVGSILGGTGLAISARCGHIEQAAAYARYVASPEVQRGDYVASGGQPGHRAAWLDEEANATTRDFFLRTLTTLDGAFLRPTDPAWIEFQVPAGEIVHAALHDGSSPRAAYDTVERCYREAYAAVR